MVNEGTWDGWEGAADMVADSRRPERRNRDANAQLKAEERAHGRRKNELTNAQRRRPTSVETTAQLTGAGDGQVGFFGVSTFYS
ncbi:hypothetical protein SESBI_47811 [Sesbania bispinosa]|nr:hypothetical protein SESBI_47811 [Sesbania bispinosa]